MSAATTAPSTAHTRAVSSSARTDAAGPLDDLDDRIGALLQNPPLDIAQPGLPRARDVALVARDQLLGDPCPGFVADQTESTNTSAVDSAPRRRRDSAATRVAQLLRPRAPDVFDGLGDQIVEGGEVVRRRRQRQPGAARDGAMPHRVEPAFAQQIGGSADQRVPPTFSLGSDRCRHVYACCQSAGSQHGAFGQASAFTQEVGCA